MALARIGKDLAIWEETIKILTPVYEGFREISQKTEAFNSSEGNTVMRIPHDEVTVRGRTMIRTPAIMAGMTYGKGKLNEVIMDNEKNGFRA
jgi:hypothetical protein